MTTNEPDEPEVGVIVEELEGLRRSGIRSSYDFLSAPTLLWHLGRGNTEVAMRFFESLPRLQHREVNASLASLGLVGRGRDLSVTDRMTEFGLAVDRDNATVRRWTDRGFLLIARMVMDWSAEEGHDQPLVEVELSPSGPTGVAIRVTCLAEPGTKLLRPEVHGPEGVLDWIEPPMEGESVQSPVVFEGRVVAQFSEDDELTPILEVFCLGNVEARFQLELLPGVMADYKAVALWSTKGFELRWQSPIGPEDAIVY